MSTPAALLRAALGLEPTASSPTLIELLDPEVEWRPAEHHPYAPPGGVGAWIGPEAVRREIIDRFATEWTEFTTNVTDLIDAGERVIVRGRYAGRFRATGRLLDAEFCVVYSFRGGRIVGFDQYMDTWALRQVMGAPDAS